MSGYPCCCHKQPGCGACHGTAPRQYQLTVPEGVFGNNAEAYPEGCGEACAQFNGVFLLDYDPELTPITISDINCVWQSPDFELCYRCDFEFDEVTIVCSDITWHWRVELSDEVPDDGFVRAYVFLISTPLSYIFMFTGEFNENCSGPLELHWDPFYLHNPPPGCVNDPAETLILEASP